MGKKKNHDGQVDEELPDIELTPARFFNIPDDIIIPKPIRELNALSVDTASASNTLNGNVFSPFMEPSHQTMVDESMHSDDRKAPYNESDFAHFIQQYRRHYIDKSLFCAEILNSSDRIIFVTKPPKFGTSMNLSTLNAFLDIESESQELFMNTQLFRESCFNAYIKSAPTIYLNLPKIDPIKIEQGEQSIKEAYTKYFLEDFIPAYFERIPSEQQDKIKKCVDYIHNSDNPYPLLETIVEGLHQQYGKQVVLIIDHYDQPFQACLYLGTALP